MATEFPSTYQQYKYKTSQALGWLITAATELGIASGTQASYGVQEMVYLAKSCALAGRPMPKKQRRWLKEAISLRRRVSERFREHGCKESNSTHAFFNEKLQSILDHFNPSNAVGVPGSIQPQQEPGTSDSQAARNYFSVLGEKHTPGENVDNDTDGDCSKQIVTEHSSEAAGSTTNSSPAKANPLADDPLMELFCLLDDASEIRTHVKQLWSRYCQAETDLVTAAFVTQYAFRHLDILQENFNQKHHSLRSHRSKILFIYYQACLGGSVFEEFCKESHEDLNKRLKETGWQPHKELRDWTMDHEDRLMKSLFKAMGKPKESATDEWLGSLFEDHDGHCDINTPVADLRRLLDLWAEADEYPDETADMDYLTAKFKCIRSSEGKVWSTYEVFMIRVVLDVLDTEGLQEYIDADIKRYMSHSRVSYMKRDHESSVAEKNKDLNKSEEDCSVNPHLGSCFPVLESRLSASRSFVFNPILLGAVLHAFTEISNMQEMDWMSEGGDLTYAAHWYHRSRVIRPDKGFSWPDMDAAIYLQRVQLFSSSDLPMTDRQCCVRMYLSFGLKLHEITCEPDEAKLIKKVGNRKSAYEVLRLKIKALRSGPKSAHNEKKANEAVEEYRAKRNTPGRKRELYIPSLYDHTRNRLPMPHSNAREARTKLEEADQKSMAGGVSCSKHLTQLEKVIRDNVAIMFFDFHGLDTIVKRGLLARAARGFHTELTCDLGNMSLSGFNSPYAQNLGTMLDDERCKTSNITTEWREFCKGVNIKIPDELA